MECKDCLLILKMYSKFGFAIDQYLQFDKLKCIIAYEY